MKIKYFGSAAAEGFPALFCDCETCRRARKAGGRNIRRRTLALVDGKLLLDFGPDTFSCFMHDGLDLPNIFSCLLTHSHEDHLCPKLIFSRSEHCAHNADKPPLTFYGTHETGNDPRWNLCEMIENSHLARDNKILFKEIEEFSPFDVEGYKVTALPAEHDRACRPVIYIIEKDGKSMLYAHDTGLFRKETWEYLEKNKPYFDLVSLDCCNGILTFNSSHMGLSGCKQEKQHLIESGCADEKTVFVLNHFSHNCLVTYDELVPIAAEDGFEVGYDGMEVEF